MKFKRTGAVIAAVALLVAGLALATTAGAGSRHALRHFEGKVVAVDAADKTFDLKDHERGTVTIAVTDRTRFEDLDGFSALHVGLKRVEAKAKRNADGDWIARKIELSGRHSSHGHGNAGRSGQSGADDPACHDKGDDHGDDDDANDDHGGHHDGADDDAGGHRGGSDDT